MIVKKYISKTRLYFEWSSEKIKIKNTNWCNQNGKVKNHLQIDDMLKILNKKQKEN